MIGYDRRWLQDFSETVSKSSRSELYPVSVRFVVGLSYVLVSMIAGFVVLLA